MIHKLFAYGTLKKNQYYHDRYLGGDKSVFIGPALASTDYSLYIDGLPHLIQEKTDKPVKGELYELDDKVVDTIDDLEGHPIVYRRELIDVYLESGERVLAWAYLRPKSFKGKQNAYKDNEFV